MATSNILEITKIKAVGYAHKAFDALVPWSGNETHENSLRKATGFYSLLAGGMLMTGVSLYNADVYEDNFVALSGADSAQALANEAFAIGLPASCGGGEYYLAQFDGDYGFYKVTDHGAQALSMGAQFDAASKIDSCLERIVKDVAQGDLNLASQFIFSGDALLSDPILVTNTGYGHSDVLFAATHGDAKPLTDYTDIEDDFANGMKLLNVLWDDAVYDDLTPQNIKTYIDPSKQAIPEQTATLKTLDRNAQSDGQMLGSILLAAFGFSLAYSGVAGHSQSYRDKRKERQEKIAALKMS